MEINIYVILIWLSSILIGSLDLVIFLGSRAVSTRAFAVTISWVTIWVACVGFFVAARDVQTALFFSRLTYYLGSVIAATFLYFFFTYPEDRKPPQWIPWSLICIEACLGYLLLLTDNIIHDLFPIIAPHPWGWHFGILSPIFEILFFGFFIAGITILYKKIRKCDDPNIKKNLQYMLWAVVIGASPASLTCIILPRFGYYGLNWLGPVTEVVWIPIITYSIIRYRQMDVRVAATQVFVIAMVMMSILNIFIDFVFGIYGRIALFVAFAALGYFLFKSLTREARQREQLTALNSTLSEKVAEQTAEIRKAYELEKHARRELEKLNETKDQFIMITQHHLRTPVTNIRWQIETMLDGTYGHVNAKLDQALHETNTSVARLTHIVDDFLNITALKVGSQILNIETGNLRPLVEEVLHELKIDIENMHLTVEYPKNAADWPDIPVDQSKMREVLLIIIENAVRYNEAGGNIVIKNRIDGDSFEMTVENTGLGLAAEDKDKLFTRHFFRSKRAQTANPIGMGIGLSVARAIVRAHHGELTIESEGEGLGAKVVLKLPI